MPQHVDFVSQQPQEGNSKYRGLYMFVGEVSQLKLTRLILHTIFKLIIRHNKLAKITYTIPPPMVRCLSR